MRRLISTIALVLVCAGLGGYTYFYLWNKTPEDTDKKEKVFPGLDFDKINELTVKSQSGDVTTLKKSSDGWQLVQPAAAKANDPDVTAIGSAIANLEITRVVDDKGTDLKEYGLDMPALRIDYKSSDGKSGGLLVGQKTTIQSAMYAKRPDSPRVFLVPSYEEAILNKSSFDLRDKAIVKFDHMKVDRIDVIAGPKTVALSKEASDWKLTRPVADRADTSAVNGLMDKIEMAQMKSIAATDPSAADLKKFGLDKPDATVTLSEGSAQTTLLIGGKADDNTVYARDASKPMVVTVDKMVADNVKSGADDYRRKDLFDFRPFNASRVEFTRQGQAVVFERVKGEKDAPDKWRRVSPNPGDVDKGKLEAMLGDFTDLRATSFAAPGTKTGLDAPALVVDARFGDDNKAEKVSFGQNGSDVFATRPAASGPGKLDASRYNDAIMKLDELAK